MASRVTIAAMALGLLWLATAPVFAQTPERVPHIDAAGQQAYHTYHTLKSNRAFAISERGGYGTGFDSPTVEAAISNAMGPCRRRDPDGPCRVYSLNGKVVWGKSPAEIAREFGIPPAASAQGAEVVPHLGGSGQEAYQRYLGTTRDRRAFAISQDGGFGWGDSWSTNEGAMKSALDKCQLLDPGGSCEIYSLNGRVVWGDPPNNLVSTASATTAATRPRAPATAPAATLPPAAARATAMGPVPHINAAGQQEYNHYKNRAFHRAFFISETGGYGYGANTYMLSSALRIAAQNCERRDPKGICKPYAIGAHVVWRQDPDTLPQFVDAPNLGVFTPTDYAPVLGPQKAKGVIIWSHGYLHGKDNTLYQPQGYVSRFLTAGWDVYRYNRRWIAQTGQASDEDAQEMVASIAAVRAAGYARIVLAGQSHGGWMSLAAVAHGAKVDGVVAVAPGKHGKEPEGIKPRADFQHLLREIRAQTPSDLPMMFVFFRDDDHDPWGRHQDVPNILGNSGARLHVIDRPEGFKGHGAGGTSRFNDIYGPCIFRFITGGTATAGNDCR